MKQKSRSPLRQLIELNLKGMENFEKIDQKETAFIVWRKRMWNFISCYFFSTWVSWKRTGVLWFSPALSYLCRIITEWL